MGILLLVIGCLAAASGALKLRGRTRAVLGTSPLSAVESALGAAVVLGSGAGLSRARPLAWTAVAVLVLLLLVSNWAFVRRFRAHTMRQSQSEQARLTAYLRHSR